MAISNKTKNCNLNCKTADYIAVVLLSIKAMLFETSSHQFTTLSFKMMRSFIFVLFALAVMAEHHHDHPHHDHHHGYHHEHPKPYHFSYGVHDDHYGPEFAQDEHSDGKVVKGNYKVHLPDGRIQVRHADCRVKLEA